MIEPHIQKIIFIDDHFLDELRHDSLTNFQNFESPVFDTKIIKLPPTEQQSKELMLQMHSSEIKVGAVLVKSGYTDQFAPVDSVVDDCAISKYQRWVELCIALGAKKVSINNIEDVSLELGDEIRKSGAVEGGNFAAKGQAEFSSEKTKKTNDAHKSIMQFNAEAIGGNPDWEEAQRILDQYGLHKDGMFRSIFDMRRVKNNHLKKHEFSLDLSKDVKRIFDSSIKAKIKLMSKFYTGQAEFDKVSASLEKQRTALKISVVVEF